MPLTSSTACLQFPWHPFASPILSLVLQTALACFRTKPRRPLHGCIEASIKAGPVRETTKPITLPTLLLKMMHSPKSTIRLVSFIPSFLLSTSPGHVVGIAAFVGTDRTIGIQNITQEFNDLYLRNKYQPLQELLHVSR